MEKEQYDVKYMRELLEYTNAYFYSLINEIYTGVAINLGMSSSDAYKLAKNNPNDLKKAKFFSNIFEKFKGIFKHKVPKFRYDKQIYGKGEPMSPEQWDKFNNYIDDYWKKNANVVAEDISIKSYMLGKETAKFEEKKKPYKNKSLLQITEDQFDGKMPDDIVTAYKNYDFTNAEKNIVNKSYSDVAMYVTQTDNNIQEAIRNQISLGMDNNLSPQEVGSNLYWEIEKNPANKYTAESLRKDWNRIAQTEMAVLANEGYLAEYESESMESMKEPEKAVYMVRVGGTCEYCRRLEGSIVRLIPREIADTSTESLKDIGIKDVNTDTYIYSGKTNVGRKRDDLQNAVPGHPYNVAQFQKINLEDEWFNPKSKQIEKRQKKDELIPKQKDYNYRSEEEKKSRKPHYISSTRVQYNNNVYESFEPSEYNKKLEEWRKNPSDNPIPVNNKSPQYKQLFDNAEKYGG